MKKEKILGFFLGIILCFYTVGAYCFPSYKTICKVLTEQDGWVSHSCVGANMQGSPMGNMVTANRTYLKKDKKIEVMIMSGMSAMGYWAPFQNNIQIDSSEQFVRLDRIRGYNVGISYNKKEKSGGIVIAFKTNSGTDQINAIMVFNFSNMDWREALSFAKKFDWDKIRKLFP